ncbi:ATP-binding protein [Actinosynnema sp. NPDC020468]|uniref:ATP-binding protein n=1 Tax=Actinosynnema sp. NPDC020468 TaxID=3154488 RepID=UPI0033FF1B61
MIEWRAEFSVAVEGVSLAGLRERVRHELVDMDRDDLDDVLLVVNELVGNAVDHAGSTGRLHVTWQHGDVLRVEVDDDSALRLRYGHSRIAETRGRGLIMVDHVATGWGVHHGTRGKTVWATLRGRLGRRAQGPRPGCRTVGVPRPRFSG